MLPCDYTSKQAKDVKDKHTGVFSTEFGHLGNRKQDLLQTDSAKREWPKNILEPRTQRGWTHSGELYSLSFLQTDKNRAINAAADWNESSIRSTV